MLCFSRPHPAGVHTFFAQRSIVRVFVGPNHLDIRPMWQSFRAASRLGAA